MKDTHIKQIELFPQKLLTFGIINFINAQQNWGELCFIFSIGTHALLIIMNTSEEVRFEI